MCDYIYKKQALEALITEKMRKWVEGRNLEFDNSIVFRLLEDWRHTPIKFMIQVMLDEKEVQELRYNEIFKDKVRDSLECLEKSFLNKAFEKIMGYNGNLNNSNGVRILNDLPYFVQISNVRTLIELDEPIEGKVRAVVALRGTLAWARPEWDEAKDIFEIKEAVRKEKLDDK